MQQLGYKILNDIVWEKPNPPPNLSCRYFTHSTETIIWAARDEKSKHVFNYAEMRKVTGKQMKTVWRSVEGRDDRAASSFNPRSSRREEAQISAPVRESQCESVPVRDPALNPIWTMPSPPPSEKLHGKHPTQKPVALLERIILASTRESDTILDPFLGAGTTAVASVRLNRNFIGIELDLQHATLAARRADREIIELVLRSLRVKIEISVIAQNDLDLFSNLIDQSAQMSDKPEIQAEQIYHETKFVFLSGDSSRTDYGR
jgi:site-specific DNA-methyltransferase (adenine-specific)